MTHYNINLPVLPWMLRQLLSSEKSSNIIIVLLLDIELLLASNKEEQVIKTNRVFFVSWRKDFFFLPARSAISTAKCCNQRENKNTKIARGAEFWA